MRQTCVQGTGCDTIRAAPDANPDDVIGARYKPVPDGSGGVTYTPASRQTIDFGTIGQRFRDFGLPINQSALNDLNRIRTDVEHYYSDKPNEAVREAIAKAFPVVADLFRLTGDAPHETLGDTWPIMLDVRAFYEGELEACRKSFENVEWPNASAAEIPFNCPECHSDLIAQDDSDNRDFQSADCHCRSCGAKIPADQAFERALEAHYETDSYIAFTDGDDRPVHVCPDCGVEAYLLVEEAVGCAWCNFVLEECARCMTGLTPENVSADNTNLCAYCDHIMSKDD